MILSRFLRSLIPAVEHVSCRLAQVLEEVEAQVGIGSVTFAAALL